MNDPSDISAYEGLVGKTAQMFARMVGLEEDDMRQELRLKILTARQAFKASRSGMTERAFVYACVANLVKDLKRNAARRHNGPLTVSHIEDWAAVGDSFELRYRRASHDEVYGLIDDGTFVLPATVTEGEQEILFLLIIGYAQTEIALQIGVEYNEVVKAMRALRAKFADWRPTAAPEPTIAPLPVGEVVTRQRVAA